MGEVPPQAPHAMNHSAFAPSATKLRSHVHKTVDFAMHVSLGDISPILPPLTAENAAARRIRWERRDRVSCERELLTWFVGRRRRSAVVHPGAVAGAGGVGDVQEGRVDDTDDGNAVEAHGDGDTEHGEEVRVVDGAIERVDDPGWGIGDEVLLGAAFAVCLFADESGLS